ncbi:MAG: hypothetical protein JSS32_05775 [Verrucomicrobia bacterium]|nr:hypothetical protein [Verrucomicrobiota bacterium]
MSSVSGRVSYDEIYDRFFPRDADGEKNWEEFRRYEAFPSEQLKADFALASRNQTWQEAAKKIVIVVLQCVFVLWGIYEGLKQLAQIVGMRKIYPAHSFGKYHVQNLRFVLEQKYQNQDKVIARDIVLEKDGVRYSGLIIGKEENLSNQKWALFAVGNYGTIEDAILMNSHVPCLRAGYNLLLVNGPSVGMSEMREGRTDPKEIGEVQELGLRFLETALKAKKIVMAGHSLGGGALGGAIENHVFDTDNIEYFAMRMMTFSRLSDIVKKLGGACADWVRWWLDYEIDSVAASQRLEQLGIHELIITAEDDEMMDQVHLGDAVKTVSVGNKTFITVRGAKYPHLGIPRELVEQAIKNWDNNPKTDNVLPDIDGVVILDQHARIQLDSGSEASA